MSEEKRPRYGFYEKELEKNQKKSKKITGNYENIPIYKRTQVSRSLLNKYPQYRDIFHKCVICDHNSLKPIITLDPTELEKVKDTIERKCKICGYTHKPKT